MLASQAFSLTSPIGRCWGSEGGGARARFGKDQLLGVGKRLAMCTPNLLMLAISPEDTFEGRVDPPGIQKRKKHIWGRGGNAS